MKNAPFVLSALAFLGVVVLFVLHFSQGSSATKTVALTPVSGSGLKCAYVNIDTLEAHYDYLIAKNEDFKRRQSQMETELQRAAQTMQAEYEQIQKKAQSNSMTQSEMEAAQKRLGQMQQSLEARKQSISETLMKEREEFTHDLKMRLDSVMERYNADKHFDFIYSYSGSSMLYANKQFDITKDVITAVNAFSKK
jgi:outer membrane protein